MVMDVCSWVLLFYARHKCASDAFLDLFLWEWKSRSVARGSFCFVFERRSNHATRLKPRSSASRERWNYRHALPHPTLLWVFICPPCTPLPTVPVWSNRLSNVALCLFGVKIAQSQAKRMARWLDHWHRLARQKKNIRLKEAGDEITSEFAMY